MGRHNIDDKYYNYVKVIIGLYVVAILSMLFLPVWNNEGTLYLGYQVKKISGGFCGIGVLLLVFFILDFFKNEHRESIKTFGTPLVFTIIFVLGFLFVDPQMMVYKQDGKFAFWGPFIFCICLAGVSYMTFLLNRIIKLMGGT